MASALTKIKDGSYKGTKGVARNIAGAGGAAHTQSRFARWLVEFSDGRTKLVGTLRHARELIA